MPTGWEAKLPVYPANKKGIASRISNGEIMQSVAEACPYSLGGSADLAPSTKTRLEDKKFGDFMPPSTGWGDFSGRNFHFDVRKHAMGAIMSGMTLCELRTFGAHGDPRVLDLHPRLCLRQGGRAHLPAHRAHGHDALHPKNCHLPPRGRQR